MIVLLMGMKHCGKSTAGRGLASAWSCDFYDADDLTERAHLDTTGEAMGFREIFRDRGAAHFRAMEARGLDRLFDAEQATRGAVVVALGGNTPCNELIAPRLAQAPVRVYLKVPVEELWRRVSAGGTPAFVDPVDPEGSFRQLCAQREAAYEAMANVTVDLTGRGAPEAAEAVRGAIEEFLAAREA